MKSKKKTSISIRISEEEKAIIEKKADMCHLTLSAYMINSALSNTSISMQPYKDKILQEVALLSNKIQLIEDKELRESMQKEAMSIWRYLNM